MQCGTNGEICGSRCFITVVIQTSLLPQVGDVLRLKELDFHGRCSQSTVTIQFHTSNIVAKGSACALLGWTLERLI